MAEIKMALQEISLAKALKIKNRLTGRLAKVQADIQAYNSVPQGQADQVNVPALLKTRDELVGALVSLKTAINEANREIQRDIYDLAEKKATAQFLGGVSTRHGPQPPVYPSTIEVNYVAALKKADVDALVARLEKEIDQLQDKLDQFNHAQKIEVDGRILELAS
jgi:DNA repair exonuclease SbcCD ATPase subunit